LPGVLSVADPDKVVNLGSQGFGDSRQSRSVFQADVALKSWHHPDGRGLPMKTILAGI
jgi:hypothetical protein